MSVPHPRPAEQRADSAKAATDATGVGGGARWRPGWGTASFLLALGPRAYVALAWTREPVWDGHYYDFGARRIAAGLGYSDDIVVGGVSIWHPWCHYPVGYSGLLGATYRLFGDGPHVGPLLNAVIGSLLAAAIYALARIAFGRSRAIVAGLLTALHPGLIAYTAVLMTELTAALGVTVAAWVAARSRGSMRGCVAAAVLVGLTTLVRPQSILLAPAIGLFAWRGASLPSRLRAALSHAILATVVALAVVTPWTLRNCRVMDGCAFVSTNVGWNLAIGAFPRATGRFETLRATDGCRLVTGQVQQDRCWLAAGVQWIRRDPTRWFALMPRKLALTFDHESFPIGYLAEADPFTWSPDRRERVRGALTAFHRALMLVAPLGLVAWPWHRRVRWPELVSLGLVGWLAWLAVAHDTHPFWPLAVVVVPLAVRRLRASPHLGPILGFAVLTVASVLVTHAVFFGEDRYHMVVTPLLCLMAAGALRAEAGAGAVSRPTSP